MTHIAVLVALAALVIATTGTPTAYLVAFAVFLAVPLMCGIEFRQAGREIDAHADYLTDLHCTTCGCAEADHEPEHWETDGFGSWATSHLVSPCQTCGDCAEYTSKVVAS